MNKRNTKKFNRRLKANRSVFEWLGYKPHFEVGLIEDIDNAFGDIVGRAKDKHPNLRVFFDFLNIMKDSTGFYTPVGSTYGETIVLTNRYCDFMNSTSHVMGKLDIVNTLAHEMTHHYQDAVLGIDMVEAASQDNIFDELEFMAEVIGCLSLMPYINTVKLTHKENGNDSLINYDMTTDETNGGVFIQRVLYLSCRYVKAPYYGQHDDVLYIHNTMVDVLKRNYKSYIPLLNMIIDDDGSHSENMFECLIHNMEQNI